MATTPKHEVSTRVEIEKPASMDEEIERLREAVRERAYQLFCEHAGIWSDPVADWLAAEGELFSKPAAEIRETDDAVEVDLAVGDLAAQDLVVKATPTGFVVAAASDRRPIQFSKRIDPDSVSAELSNGTLRVRARTVEEPARTVEVRAA